MSSNDFLNGRMAANFANSRAAADAHEAIVEWKAFSIKLQNELAKVELDFVKAESGRIGFAHLCRTVVEELRRIDPNNPLLQKENQLQIVGTKMVEKAAEMGYVYDMRSDRITGKR